MKNDWKTWILLFFLLFIMYGQTLRFKRVIYDGQRVLVQNTVVKGSWDLKRLLSTDYWGQGTKKSTGSYRPIPVLSMWVDYHLWGDWFGPYYFMQILWMWLICILLIFFGVHLGLSEQVSVTGSIIFALHPVHTDIIASLAGRADLLFTFFFLLFTLVHGKRGWYNRVFAFSLFLLGLSSKEFFVFAIPIVFFLDLFGPTPSSETPNVVQEEAMKDGQDEKASQIGSKFRRLPWLVYAGYCGIVAGFFIIRLVVTGKSLKIPYGFYENSLLFESIWIRLLNVPVIFLRYISILFSPTQLSFDRTYDAVPVIRTFWSLPLLLGSLALLALGYVAWKMREQKQGRFLLFLFASFYFPLSNVMIVSSQSVADRWLFAPSIPFCLGLGVLFHFAYARIAVEDIFRKRLYIVALVSYLGIFMAIGHHYAWQWRSEFPLYEYSIKNEPNSMKINDLYGHELMKRKRYKEAFLCFQKVLKYNHNMVSARLSTAFILEHWGKNKMAEKVLYDTYKKHAKHFPKARTKWFSFLRRHHRTKELQKYLKTKK